MTVSTQLDIFQQDSSNQDFWNYHRSNPSIYKKFEELALEAIGRGFKHYSAEAILNIARWHTNVSSKDNDDFKINNNYRSGFARLFAIDHPEHADFFFRRRSKRDSMLKSNSLLKEAV